VPFAHAREIINAYRKQNTSEACQHRQQSHHTWVCCKGRNHSITGWDSLLHIMNRCSCGSRCGRLTAYISNMCSELFQTVSHGPALMIVCSGRWLLGTGALHGRLLPGVGAGADLLREAGRHQHHRARRLPRCCSHRVRWDTVARHGLCAIAAMLRVRYGQGHVIQPAATAKPAFGLHGKYVSDDRKLSIRDLAMLSCNQH